MHCMPSGKRIQCWLLLFVLPCLVGCREAKRKAPRRALLFDSFSEEANEKGTFILGVVGVAESQSVPLEETELGKERRLLLGSTQDYDPRVPIRTMTKATILSEMESYSKQLMKIKEKYEALECT